MDYTLDKLVKAYIEEIVKLYGVQITISSVQDSRFTSHFWKALQQALGTKLQFSSAFHPQTDGQLKKTIQALEDMLRAYVMDLSGSLDNHIFLEEFAYNNSYHISIGMAPYEALYEGNVFHQFVGKRLVSGN